MRIYFNFFEKSIDFCIRIVYNTQCQEVLTEREENKMQYNERTVNVKINRGELCDLLIALNVIDDEARELDPNNHKWSDLHDKLVGILDAFDEAHAGLIS